MLRERVEGATGFVGFRRLAAAGSRQAHPHAARDGLGERRADHDELADFAAIEFVPPEDIEPAEGGIVLRERVRPEHQVAWLLDAAHRGEIDIARFGDFATPTFTNARVRENYSRRFSIRFPNEELPAARPLKTTPIYDRLLAAGAHGARWDLPVWADAVDAFTRELQRVVVR